MSVDYDYDEGTYGIGFRTSMEDGTGSTSWTYDERGRLVKETKWIDSQSFTTEWDYNQADMLTWMKYPDSEEVTYSYTERMLLESVSGTNTYIDNMTYDSAGRVLTRELGNGLTQTFGYYDWDEKVNNVGQGGRLETLATGTIQNLSYVYDSVGNITQITNTSANEANIFSYDALNRLTSWQLNQNSAENYTYDSAGNLNLKGALDLDYEDANHVHAVTDANGNSYEYDANGNQTVREIGQDTYDLNYDAENRLVEVKKNDSTIALFTYNGDGQRVKSIVDGETILFIGGYYQKKGTEVTKYYPGGAMRKYVIPQSMSVEYVLGDHLGSASVMTDSLGNKISEMRYSPWGEVRYSWVDSNLSTTPAYTLPKQTFTGQYSYMDDPSTQATEGFGLMFYQSRFYDPQIGRFTQADSIVPGGVQGLDRYTYVNSSPVTYIDPSGHKPCWATKHYTCNLTQEQINELFQSESGIKFLDNILKETGTIIIFACGLGTGPDCEDDEYEGQKPFSTYSAGFSPSNIIFIGPSSDKEKLEDYENDILDVISKNPGKNFILVGHSYGADAVLGVTHILDLLHKCAIIGTCDTKPYKNSMRKTSNDAQASSATPLNKCWESWKQACVTLAGQPHSAGRISY